MSGAQFAIIGVPSSAGARLVGQEGAPSALRAAGLVSSLTDLGFGVIDHGDLARVESRPDPKNPRARNAGLVGRVARDVAAKVEAASGSGALPVILGGDCSITIGVLAGLLAQGSSLGLLYFDGDLDLNTPDTTPSGAFDGMVTAHILGRGDSQLARIGPRYPLLQESHVAYFGYNESAGAIDPPELLALERSAALRYPVEAIREDPRATAREALSTLESRVERILVHFDLDVTDVPAVDVEHPNALPLDTAALILEIFLGSPKCAGLVVTELNVRLDADGSQARRVANRLVQALASARSRAT
ncbi:MAG: arginase family protein [Acidobacteria bacterium]|nr:arginase family protein [Acidobacteriota bacterium]